jgi:DeoR/GlpR family transcriptional regulator of sugar metabolism
MLESERVEILSNLLAEQGFLTILDLIAATGVSAATEAA